MKKRIDILLLVALSIGGAILVLLFLAIDDKDDNSSPILSLTNNINRNKIEATEMENNNGKEFKILPPFENPAPAQNFNDNSKEQKEFLVKENQKEVSPPVSFFNPEPADDKKRLSPPQKIFSKDQLLDFPEIALSELNIVSDGFSNRESFLEYFTVNAEKINFDYKRFDSLEKDVNGFFLLPTDLAEKALKGGNFEQIRQSLAALSEFLRAKIDFLKSIKVTRDGIRINSYMIGADLLTLELINKTFKAEANSLAKEALANYYEKYQKTIVFYGDRFRENEFAGNDQNIFDKLLTISGLKVKTAQAVAAIPFGGLVTASFLCICQGGFNLLLTPGFNGFSITPGSYNFFISIGTLASPLLFLNKKPFPGNWILGNYLLVPGPCLGGAFCAPSGAYIGTIIMAGTS